MYEIRALSIPLHCSRETLHLCDIVIQHLELCGATPSTLCGVEDASLLLRTKLIVTIRRALLSQDHMQCLRRVDAEST